MKKALFVLIALVIACAIFAQFQFLEPTVLGDGKGVISLGVESFAKYGVLDLMEVGLAPLPYIKLGTSIGSVWTALGYGYVPAIGFLDDLNMAFIGVGYYPGTFSLSLSTAYAEETKHEYDEGINDWLETTERSIALVSVLAFYNQGKNGEVKLTGGFSRNLTLSENTAYIDMKVGGSYPWDWWIFDDVFIYGGLGTYFPFEDLGSVVILGSIGARFSLLR